MCGGKGYYCEHSTVETCWCVKPTPKADEVSELRAEVARLRTRLEISDKHPYDGIDCRDETIKGLERLIQGRWRPEMERLEAENAELRKSLKALIHISDATGWEQHSCGEIAKARKALEDQHHG